MRWIGSISWLTFVLFIMGCSRPSITETDDTQPGVFVQPRLNFSMLNAGFWTNGTLRSDRISLSSSDFRMLFVHLPESGLYIVTTERTDSSGRTGRFSENELIFTGGRTEIRFRSQSEHLFADQTDRDAWVEFLPGFRISGSGAGSDVAIVGLARERSHIPGLD